MRHEWWCVGLLLMIGCSAGDNGAPPSTSTTSAATAVTTAPQPPADGPEQLPVGPGPEVAVSGGLLPSAVTSAITSKGGELADTASWDARYETFGLPRVAGPGVRLVAGEIEASAVDGGWQRRDALQWLLMDVSHASLDSILNELAAAADVSNWAVSERQEAVGNGDCTERTFTTPTSEATWKLSGCTYPDFAGMFAVAVERSGTFVNAPSPIDPSVAALVSSVDGQVTTVSVVFDHPTSTGSAVTLTATATVSFDAGLADAEATLTAGPLAGWRVAPGEGSVMYSGGIGTRWVVSSGEATLTATGRLSS